MFQCNNNFSGKYWKMLGHREVGSQQLSCFFCIYQQYAMFI